MTTSIRNGLRAVYIAYSAVKALWDFLICPFTKMAEAARDKKLILAVAKPTWAYSNFTAYKEATIESRTIQDSRGRVLAQVKLWIYLGERKCYREVKFLNHLLLASVGINRLPFLPLEVGQSDTPAALLEVTVRELESWLRNRTPGTQFGIESARNAASKPQNLRVVSVLPDPEKPVPVEQRPAEKVYAQPQQPVPQNAPPYKAPPVAAPLESQTAQFQRGAQRSDIKAKAVEFTCGILQSVGTQERTTGNRQFKQYCFDIVLEDGDSRGMVKRIWGADLERALTESHALLGQRVEVCHHGSMPMANSSGGSSYKNSYSVRVLK